MTVCNLKFTAEGPFVIGKHLTIKENPYKSYSKEDLEYSLKVHGSPKPLFEKDEEGSKLLAEFYKEAACVNDYSEQNFRKVVSDGTLITTTLKKAPGNMNMQTIWLGSIEQSKFLTQRSGDIRFLSAEEMETCLSYL